LVPKWVRADLQRLASNSLEIRPETEIRILAVSSLSGLLNSYFRGELMAKKPSINSHKASAQPRYHQSARELQAFGTVTATLPLQLEEPVRLEMTEQLNQLLADTMTLRDLYKKSHWQVAGATFYQLHLLFDKHHEEQSELVDTIAERIQLLGGISIAMAADVAETTRIPRPPKGREEVPVQLSRLLDAHQVILSHCRELAERSDKLGDAGTNDMVVSDVLRTGELQVWFLSEHLVEAPLVEAEDMRESA
jgi:starvation-inducible DNA-binding protein